MAVDESLLAESDVDDDRDLDRPRTRSVLVIENDLPFMRILMDRAREKGFKCLAAVRGDVGLAMARHYQPDAITLDIDLPGMDGWSVLDRLKHDPATRHIPVHIISMADDAHRGMRLGAMAYLSKPVEREALDEAFASIRGFLDRKVRNLLVVEDNDVERQAIVELIGNGDVKTTAVGTAARKLWRCSKQQPFDCLVLDLGLADMSGFDLLERMKANPQLVARAGHRLHRQGADQEAGNRAAAAGRDDHRQRRQVARSPARRNRALPAPRGKQSAAGEAPHARTAAPARSRRWPGTKALIVDDDIRNIFALTSVLERHQVDVLYAENGRDGIRLLQDTPDVDVVLMDVMMPEMDGYEAMRRIRGAAAVQEPADHRADGEGDERRPGEVHRGGRVGLHHQAGRHRSAAVADACMGLEVSERGGDPAATSRPWSSTCCSKASSVTTATTSAAMRAARSGAGSQRSCRPKGSTTLSARCRIASCTISAAWDRFLQGISVNVSAMFRDPAFFLAFRRVAVPLLRTYPFIRIWQAGASLRRGSLLARDPACTKKGLYQRSSDLRDRHQRRGAAQGARRHLSGRCDAALHAELHAGRRHAQLFGVLHRALRVRDHAARRCARTSCSRSTTSSPTARSTSSTSCCAAT